MTTPALVLVHGGQHTARCWDPTVASLARKAPDLPVLAVDLPGRGGTPGDLATLTIAQCVDSVVQDVERAGFDRIVLVGHSMAGVTLPGVAARLGAERVARLVYVACCIPRQSEAILDTLTGPVRAFARRAAARKAVSPPMARPMAAMMFCNGMTKSQKEFVFSNLCAEAVSLTVEPVDRSNVPPDIPRTWVLPLRDRSLRPKQQRAFIDNLGGVENVVEIDTCHDVMISEPDRLAEALIAASVTGGG